MKNVIGADETGVGDYLTPLVAAAAFVQPKDYETLESLGVRDSKQLSNLQIKTIYTAIRPYIKYSVRSLSQANYNYLTEVKKLNAHELKTLLHWKAINALEKRISQPELVIIDQYASESNVAKYIERLTTLKELTPFQTPYELMEKAESQSLCVAVASIVARKYLLDYMEMQRKKWNFTFPLGASSLVIDAAKQFVKLHGKTNLYQVAKLSFKTTKAVLEN